MDLQKLKNTISVVESADNNIKNYEKLKGRELALIPTDSDYFRNFKHYVEKEKIYYDGETEKSPMYISKSNSDKIINILIDTQINFSALHRSDLLRIMEVAK
jgi:CRISPR/Cas system Type II protein with McrA/HNH and RuvC-like nuclease domain